MTTEATFWIVSATFGGVLGILLWVLTRLVAWGLDAGKVWHIELDGDTMTADMHRVRPKNGANVQKRQKRQVFLSGKGATHTQEGKRFGYLRKSGPLFITDKKTGLNLKAPQSTTIQKHADPRFIVCDPGLAYFKMQTNLRQDFLMKNEDARAAMMEKLAIPLMVVAIATLAVVGYVATKFVPGATGGI